MRVLVLGASGMLGNAVMRVLSEDKDFEVFGTIRSSEAKKYFTQRIAEHLVDDCDVLNDNALIRIIDQIRPDVVINCISVAKRLMNDGSPLLLLAIFSMLPHRLSELCAVMKARLVHISTDGVFSGSRGMYSENDPTDARDLYGLTKYLGELHNLHTITLRTSIIGHELEGTNGLINWFLSQSGSCNGYTKVIYSGLPTVILARIIRDLVVPRPDLFGLYHVAAQPITKYDLLQMVAQVYGKSIDLIRDDSKISDLSLDCTRFKLATGYVASDWPELIRIMREDWSMRLR